jgi:hypothetical protein
VCCCGNEIVQAPGKGRLKTYCSKACKDAARPKRVYVSVNKPKAIKKPVYVKTREQIKNESIDKRRRVCIFCGKEYIKTRSASDPDGNKFCSKECSGKSRRVEPKPKYSKVYFKKCNYCSSILVRRNNINVVTCKSCNNKRVIENERIKLIANYVPKTFLCKECNLEHTTEYGRKGYLFCSTRCSDTHHGRTGSAIRRARKSGAQSVSFNPIDILSRDGWVCRQCGVDTPRKLRGSIEHNAPEIDHIIPLSKGGAHSPGNTQCLCRRCNGIKSDIYTPGGSDSSSFPFPRPSADTNFYDREIELLGVVIYLLIINKFI